MIGSGSGSTRHDCSIVQRSSSSDLLRYSSDCAVQRISEALLIGADRSGSFSKPGQGCKVGLRLKPLRGTERACRLMTDCGPAGFWGESYLQTVTSDCGAVNDTPGQSQEFLAR
ncbi:hypothetical protein RRG08_007017 [Elysia crispata]|uniref:Uncharacterized protein n=1 Tax=Elysia crispata TaxID=231223 RepID=A0AAE0ZIW0_9GAST|nr:hypothetical protein RRG08_007017 [Elysia crispata]